jgi:hypothetical protein
MKPASPDMIEGTEAWERFRDAAQKMMSVPKSAIPNPFSKPKAKKKKASREKATGDVSKDARSNR